MDTEPLPSIETDAHNTSSKILLVNTLLKKHFYILLILLFIIASSIVVVASIQKDRATNTLSEKQRSDQAHQQTNQSVIPSVTPLPITLIPGPLIDTSLIEEQKKITHANSFFAGQLHVLNQDLQLVASDSSNVKPYPDRYYLAGVYTKGKYKDYVRIILVAGISSYNGYRVLTFATQNNGLYILDGAQKGTSVHAQEEYESQFYGLNTNKIIRAEPLDSDHTITLALDKDNFHFALYKKTDDILVTRNTDNTRVDLVTNFSDLTRLSSTPSLQFFSNVLQKNSLTKDMTSEDQQYMEIQNTFLASTTEVVAVDSIGLAVSYNLTTAKNINLHTEKPDDYSRMPNLRFSNKDIHPAGSFYSSYDVALPHVCGTDINTYVVKNIQDSDLVKVGFENNIEIFSLVNGNHPLDSLAYYTKMHHFQTNEEFKQFNKTDKPTFEQYIQKHPLLFFKDYWERWVMLGEYDYQLPGGCGKPVLYLYPTTPTNVHISFIHPMQLDTHIPTYHNEWHVLAAPNGTLRDLQPQFTDCRNISNKKGSEYAHHACENNRYPYLYWSGKSLQNPYPRIDSGWIVERKDLEHFMNTTLENIGMTNTEKADMMSYWIPEMMTHNAPFYRISFLQTLDMNRLVPMNIIPTPTTFYRIFLDYLPLAKKPLENLPEEILQPIIRNGFTVIEWGGLLH